jgi:alcohol dehydrogenase (NADP+)
MAAATRCIALKSGCTMPCIGLGTFLATKPGEVGAAVKAAVSSGYRLIDCAAGYGNQAEIGEALQEIFAEGMVKREDLFIVSKLFQTHHGKRGPLRWLAVDRAACTRAGWKED